METANRLKAFNLSVCLRSEATCQSLRIWPFWATPGMNLCCFLFYISLIFNLVFAVCGMTAFCCRYSRELIWCICPCFKPRRKAKHEVYIITKYGDRAHSTVDCPTLEIDVFDSVCPPFTRFVLWFRRLWQLCRRQSRKSRL